MGFCTQFRRTWRPDSGVINPNKSFDNERRKVLFKKFVIFSIILTLLIGLIYFGVTSFANKIHDESLNESEHPHIVKSGSFGPVASVLSGDDETISVSGLTNSSLVLPDSEESYTKFVITTIDNTMPNGSDPNTHPIMNVKETVRQNSSGGVACSPGGSISDCVGISKTFKSVVSFSNSTINQTGSIEGYVMLKITANTWQAYCRSKWTLDMGYKLCQGLGLQQLLRLETIPMKDLKERIGHKLGTRVSLLAQNLTQLPHNLTDNRPGTNIRRLQSRSPQQSCEVGYISCKNLSS